MLDSLVLCEKNYVSGGAQACGPLWAMPSLLDHPEEADGNPVIRRRVGKRQVRNGRQAMTRAGRRGPSKPRHLAPDLSVEWPIPEKRVCRPRDVPCEVQMEAGQPPDQKGWTRWTSHRVTIWPTG